MTDTWNNKLYFGDNFPVMREHIADETVDLIYLDPPQHEGMKPVSMKRRSLSAGEP